MSHGAAVMIEVWGDPLSVVEGVVALAVNRRSYRVLSLTEQAATHQPKGLSGAAGLQVQCSGLAKAALDTTQVRPAPGRDRPASGGRKHARVGFCLCSEHSIA